MIRFSTEVIAGRRHAARSASSCSAQERTVPRRVALPPLHLDRDALRSSCALRTSASSSFPSAPRRRPASRGSGWSRPGRRIVVAPPAPRPLPVPSICFAFERDPALGDGDVELVDRDQASHSAPAPPPRRCRVRRSAETESRTPMSLATAITPLTGGRFLGRPPLPVEVDQARERHHAVLDGTSISLVCYPRLAARFGQHVPLNCSSVERGGALHGRRAPRCTSFTCFRSHLFGARATPDCLPGGSAAWVRAHADPGARPV